MEHHQPDSQTANYGLTRSFHVSTSPEPPESRLVARFHSKRQPPGTRPDRGQPENPKIGPIPERRGARSLSTDSHDQIPPKAGCYSGLGVLPATRSARRGNPREGGDPRGPSAQRQSPKRRTRPPTPKAFPMQSHGRPRARGRLTMTYSSRCAFVEPIDRGLVPP